MSKFKEKIKLISERFVSTLVSVAETLGKSPDSVTRDEYIRISVDMDFQERLNKEELQALGGFKFAKQSLYKKTKEEFLLEDKAQLESAYLDHIKEIGLTPTLGMIESWGFTNRFITKNYGSMKGLYTSLSKENPEHFSNLVNDFIFTKKYFESVKESIKSKKIFIVTTAVSGKPVHEAALKSIQSYSKIRNASIMVLPCEDVASRKSTFNFELDRRLSDCLFVGKDLYLNKNIHLSSITVSAKQINPLTGLDRLAQSKGSAILASPKQYLSYVSTSNTKLPHALMTTGAITINDYSTDTYMSKRTSYLAEFDHVEGALIVEIEDSNIYHFRQIQFDKDGSFYDLGTKYNSDGSVFKVEETVCVFGDTHVGSHDLQVNESLKQITKLVNAKEIIVHDLFDNRFNNHHDIGKPVIKAMMSRKGITSLLREGMITKDWLEDWSSRINKITIVKSNHDEALDRYINEGRWLYDSENLYDSLLLVRARMEGKDPLKFLVEDLCKLANPSAINWLDRDSDYVVYGIVNDAHGDKGANGSRGSLRNLEKSYFKATIGHSHSAGIFRNIYQVGTSSELKLSYNVGPSSWTHTMCIQYPNGQRQLINMVKNKNGKMTFKI